MGFNVGVRACVTVVVEHVPMVNTPTHTFAMEIRVS